MPALLFSQFLSEGASWQYEVFGFAFDGYSVLSKTTDTLIADRNCLILGEESLLTNWVDGRRFSDYRRERAILSESDSIVYVHIRDELFDTLYNFKAAPGDGWSVSYPTLFNNSDSVHVSVHSKGISEITGQSLLWLEVSYSSYLPNIYRDAIYQLMGNVTGFLVPWQYYYPDLDGPSYSFQCYQDIPLGTYSKSADCTLENVAIHAFHPLSELTVYPNPARQSLTVHAAKQDDQVQLILYDRFARILLQESFVGTQNISVEHLSKGIYFLRIVNDQGMIATRKVTVH